MRQTIVRRILPREHADRGKVTHADHGQRINPGRIDNDARIRVDQMWWPEAPELREVPRPRPSKGEVLVRITAALYAMESGNNRRTCRGETTTDNGLATIRRPLKPWRPTQFWSLFVNNSCPFDLLGGRY